MSWHTALDHQTMLVEMWRSPEGRKYGLAFSRAIQGGDFEISPVESVSTWEEIKIGGSEPMFVTAEVLDVIDSARETFKAETLVQEDIIVPWGFAVFERPILIPDAKGIPIAFRAVGWAPLKEGAVYDGLHSGYRRAYLSDEIEGASSIIFSMYSDPRDDTPEQLAAYGSNAPDVLDRWPLHISHYTPYRFGTAEDAAISPEDAADPIRHQSSQSFYKFVQVFFRLMRQRIAVRWEEHAPRPARRRAQRAGVPVRKVLIVTLRRPSNAKPSEGESSGVEWSHRWIVGGHWRNQWYGSGENRHQRQVWISDFVKGPDDKPLVVKPRAFEFAR